MRVLDWIGAPPESLLDVGCNAGAWLHQCSIEFPTARLAGTDINEVSLVKAVQTLRKAVVVRAGAELLPFKSESFQYMTCMEVLEHIPAELRSAAVAEMRRVLMPNGRLVLTVPHRGLFAFLDSNNIRFRLPALYKLLVRHGRRDRVYSAAGRHVEWHHHFNQADLIELLGPGWRVSAVRRGGLVVYPLMDWLSWPFYRTGNPNHWLRKFFERLASMDYNIDFGRASYGILLVADKVVDV